MKINEKNIRKLIQKLINSCVPNDEMCAMCWYCGYDECPQIKAKIITKWWDNKKQ